MRIRNVYRSMLMASSGLCLFGVVPALAQSEGAGPSDIDSGWADGATNATPGAMGADEAPLVDEIIVTARRREETSLSVPVAITAVSGAQLNDRGISNVDALARSVPTLITSEATSSPQGGIVSLRGLSGVDANPFSDQAVSFNIDGVPVARSSVRRLSQMDIAQIEVLKGPQALFFGKNSPAGIIAVRSNDPTEYLSASITAGYEFNADEFRTEGYVSVPVTDTLGVRVAAYYSTMEGYITNVAPNSGAGVRVPFDRRVPNGYEYAVRGTVKWEPSDQFDARLKVSYNKADGSGSTDVLQFVDCPLGVPQGTPAGYPTPENCKADDRVTASDNIGPNFQAADSRFEEETFLRSDQILGSLEMNLNLTDTLTLSSITGYYDANNSYIGSFTANFLEAGIPQTFLPAYARLKVREITEEVRLTSSFDGPVNLMVGGLYQDSKAESEAVVYLLSNTPFFSSNYAYQQDGLAYSIFGQVMVDLSENLEFSGGARYSYERKSLPVFTGAVRSAPADLIDISAPRRVSFNNLSPEATLTYRPSRNLTAYASYKEGFLSGGFNATQPVVAPNPNGQGQLVSLIDPRYDQQLIHGFEGGLKASLLGGDLRTNLAIYDYDTTGLQVAVLVGLQQELRNAGEVSTRGVEFDFSYRTPLEGLNLYGAVAYEDGKYTDYQATCYRGLPAPECRVQVNRFTGQPGQLQDLSGTQLARAPDWMGNVGFTYESSEFSGLKIGTQGNVSFSSSFFTDVTSSPGGRQGSYQLFDAGIKLMDADDRWEIGLLGRNLTDEYYFTRSAGNPFSGGAPGGTSTLLADTVAVASRGREIWVRATYRFGN
ncbi:TonB-dependent receptor [Parasphingorhabdus sp.]|uniref:TonB-dependent receptor n=1 Tax=Parasphingorhabdus sp. TaxID=2709688 RepID=UPI003A8E9F6C